MSALKSRLAPYLLSSSLALLSSSLALATAAQAGDSGPTGLELLEHCREVQSGVAADALDADQQRNYGYCMGYVVGYVSGFAARDASGAAGRFCPPSGARIVDFARAINGWLVAHPEGLERMGAAVALSAFQWKFPCPDEVRKDAPQ